MEQTGQFIHSVIGQKTYICTTAARATLAFNSIWILLGIPTTFSGEETCRTILWHVCFQCVSLFSLVFHCFHGFYRFYSSRFDSSLLVQEYNCWSCLFYAPYAVNKINKTEFQRWTSTFPYNGQTKSGENMESFFQQAIVYNFYETPIISGCSLLMSMLFTRIKLVERRVNGAFQNQVRNCSHEFTLSDIQFMCFVFYNFSSFCLRHLTCLSCVGGSCKQARIKVQPHCYFLIRWINTLDPRDWTTLKWHPVAFLHMWR